MAETSNLAQDFHNIDSSTASSHAVRFLDEFNTNERVMEIQRMAHRMLGAREGAHLLDAGCGVGDVARELGALVGPTGRVVGVDQSEQLIAEARKRTEGTGLRVEYQQGDIHRLDFLPSESFDGCRSSRVFIYLEDPRQVLSELFRLTRPGGAVVVFEPELDSWVLDGPDRDVVRKLVHFWAEQLRNPWIGRQLKSLFRSLDIPDVTVQPVVGLWTYAMLETFGFHSVMEKALEAGVATREQVDAWVEFMKERTRTGGFYGSMTGMIVRGIKPGV